MQILKAAHIAKTFWKKKKKKENAGGHTLLISKTAAELKNSNSLVLA